ncbi:tetratricopeptide repeat protein [Laceyella putida]|uniref:Tetratricopeptide repeat protein n=1 Tax=Laceyella putida TaxID=110101 RepID=A0ABW2RM34_9BACL
MYHQQWLELVQQALSEIETQYAQSPVSEKPKWRNRFREIKKSCDQMLESWAVIAEQLAELMEKYPDLNEEEKEIEEEVWLHESAVRSFRQGQGYYGLTMFKEAKQLFEEVVEHEPDFLLGRIYLGLSQFHEGELHEAERHFQLVTNTASHDSFVGFAHHMLGCIAVKRGDDRKAIKQFSKVTSLLPDHEDAWFNLGACHFRLGEYHEAVPYFYHALSVNEDDWEAMYYLSHCYRHCQEWNSVSFWRLASYEKTHHPRILESIAHDYEEMGDHEQALEWYQRLLASDPKRTGAYHGMAWNLWALKRTDEAIMWLKKGLTLFRDDQPLLFAYVWMSMASGQMRKAVHALDLLPLEQVEQPMWLAMRSRLSSQQGDYQEASRLAEQLMEQEIPTLKAMGHYQKGRIFLEQKNVDEAIRHFKEARQLAKDWKDPLFFEGVCHLMNGCPDHTRSCWSEIVT